MIKKIILLLITFIILLLGTLYYQVELKKTEVVTYENGIHTLSVFMIGEPDWPFGRTHCCFKLKEKQKKIVEYKFSVRNDGCFVSENNFDVDWYNDYVILSVNGEEQNIVEYRVDYNGNIIN